MRRETRYCPSCGGQVALRYDMGTRCAVCDRLLGPGPGRPVREITRAAPEAVAGFVAAARAMIEGGKP